MKLLGGGGGGGGNPTLSPPPYLDHSSASNVNPTRNIMQESGKIFRFLNVSYIAILKDSCKNLTRTF